MSAFPPPAAQPDDPGVASRTKARNCSSLSLKMNSASAYSGRSIIQPKSPSAPADANCDGITCTAGLLATEGADQLARAIAQRTHMLAHVGQAGPQLRVADLDGEHGVLQLGEGVVRARDGVHRQVEEAADAVRRRAGRCGAEGAGRQAVALGEGGVGAARAAVGDLDGTEELVL